MTSSEVKHGTKDGYNNHKCRCSLCRVAWAKYINVRKYKKRVTIVLPISRIEYLKPVFDCLKNLETPGYTELLIITDGDVALERAVDKRLDSISFVRIQVVSYGEKPAKTIKERRYRIASIHNFAKTYVSDTSDYVFLIEDDTTYAPNTLTEFIKTLKRVKDRMYVEGVQLGRHNTPYVGGWKINNIKRPELVISVMPEDGVEYISAGGFYCALTDAELYKMHHFEPFDKVGTNGLSCDVNYGLYLRQQGYKCMIDWDIQCDHIGDKGSVNIGNTKPCQIQFKKENNKWSCKRI